MEPVIAEDALRCAWTEALGTSVSCDDNFFARGGDSLKALAVAVGLRRRLAVTVDPGWLYDVPHFTDALADLQRRLNVGVKCGAVEIIPGSRDGDHPLSFQQEGLLAWADRFGDRHHHRLVYAVAAPAGSLDPGRLRSAVDWQGQRHPALCTSVRNGRQYVSDRRLEFHTIFSSAGTQVEVARKWAGEHFADGGPLARVALIFGVEEDLLVMAAHQLVMDPWSWGLFLRDVSAHYAVPDTPDTSVLAYSDYARWQRGYLTGRRFTEHLEFWRMVAAGYRSEGVPLPGAPVVAEPAGPASRLPITVPAALVADLQAIGRQVGASLFQVLLALFHAAVAAWAGVEDVVVGSATANRTVPGTDQAVGFFVNGRFTRSQPTRHTTLEGLIRSIRDEWHAGDAHQELHLEKTVFDLGVPDLVNIKFSLDTIPTIDPLPDLGGQRLRHVGLAEVSTSRRHLALSLTCVDNGLAGGLIYRTDLLKAENAAGLLSQFERIIREAASEQARR